MNASKENNTYVGNINSVPTFYIRILYEKLCQKKKVCDTFLFDIFMQFFLISIVNGIHGISSTK